MLVTVLRPMASFGAGEEICELIAEGPVKEHGNHRGVHPARERAEDAIRVTVCLMAATSVSPPRR